MLFTHVIFVPVVFPIFAYKNDAANLPCKAEVC